MTQTLDLSKLSPKQVANLQRALIRLAAEEAHAVPEEADLSKVPVFLITHDPDNVNVYRAEGDKLIHSSGDKFDRYIGSGDNKREITICPITKGPLGHAPSAYNGIPIESYEDHIGLRSGDASVLAKYMSRPNAAAEETGL